MDVNTVVDLLRHRLNPYGRTIYYACRGEIVTWSILRVRCGLSNNQISVGWENLRYIGIAHGDITLGREGMVLEVPDKFDMSIGDAIVHGLNELVTDHYTSLRRINADKQSITLSHKFVSKSVALCHATIDGDELIIGRIDRTPRPKHDRSHSPMKTVVLSLNISDSIDVLEQIWKDTAADCHICKREGK